MAGLYGNDTVAQVCVSVSLSILIAIDLIGNTLVILIIVTNKAMKSPMNYLLINLAVADMMAGVFIAPKYIISPLFEHPDGIIGEVLCKVLNEISLATFGSAASVLTQVVISFERYFSVMYPLSTKLKLSVRKVKRIVLACWMLAVLITSPLFFAITFDDDSKMCKEKWPKEWHLTAYSILWMVTAGIIPVTTIFVLYSRVIYTLWFKHSKHRVQGTQLAMLKSRKRVTKMMIAVSVIYCVCWIPHISFYLFLYHQSESLIFIISIVLVTCNSTVNPFIYTLQSEKFRRHLKELVCCDRFRRNLRSVVIPKDSLKAVSP